MTIPSVMPARPAHAARVPTPASICPAIPARATHRPTIVLAQVGDVYVSFSVMPSPAPPTPAERFALIIEGLCRAVAARGAGGRLAGPLIVLIWTRLGRLAGRFAALAARVAAGTASPRRSASPRRASQRPRPPYRRLPRRFAWLPRLVPEAAAYGAQLQHLLSDPEMAALVAAAPQAGRLLRPLCRMLGVRPPPGLHKPPAAPPTGPPRSAPLPATSPRPRRPVPGPAPMVPRHACGPPVAT
jgi:hypothetical protein